MRAPVRIKGNGPMARVSRSASVPSPVGGWNDRDALAAMKPTDAVILDNLFPRPTYVELRGGCSAHATGLAAPAYTLAVHKGLTGAGQMFAATDSGVFDVTAAGAVGVAKAARTDGKHQWINYGDGTNNYLIMVNGADAPLYFDGTNWVAITGVSSPALTGVSPTTLIGVFASKGRLFFIQKDTLSLWYLAAGAAGGALTEFALDGVAQKGGYLMAGETWTFDGGDGLDDAVALVTSEGEVLVYKGTNPSSSTTWALVGRYDIGRPLGRRCMRRYGGDVLVLTETGVFPLSALMQVKVEDRPRLALSSQIENSFSRAARTSINTFGWEATFLPGQQALLINVPDFTRGDQRVQYVMNTLTKAWCRFTGWDAETFAVLDGTLYYGGNGTVYKAWTGASDAGAAISGRAKPAFNYFGTKGVIKRLTLYRPVLELRGDLRYLTGVDYDYVNSTLTGQTASEGPAQDVWDTALWDEAVWAAGAEMKAAWSTPQGAAASGHCFTVKLQLDSSNTEVKWIASDFVFEEGAVV